MKPSLRFFCGLIAVGSSSMWATPTISSLTPNPAAPQPVGTTIAWTAVASDSDPGSLEYQFQAQPTGTPVLIRQDYSPVTTWTWVPIGINGAFTVAVTVKNTSTQNTAVLAVPYQVSSRVVGGVAAITPTNNPLVALFSASACQIPNVMQVRFSPVLGGASQVTGVIPCRSSATPPFNNTSMNFLVAGMYPNTTYQMRWETISPQGQTLHVGAYKTFATGALGAGVYFPTFTVVTPPLQGDNQQNLLLQAFLTIPQPGIPVPTATDLNGNILWYYQQPVSEFGRTEYGGYMWFTQISSNPSQSFLEEIDLAGDVVVQTNVARMNEQLAAKGHAPITAFHHEARRINTTLNGVAPDGWIITLGSREWVDTIGVQGGTPANPVDVLGDEVLVLDSNLQLVWAWDEFAFLQVARLATLDDKCAHANPGCPPFSSNFSTANDWTHSNSVQYTPWDQNLLVSVRNQDWVVKMKFQNGAGDGSVIYVLGLQGSPFTLTPPSSGPDIGYPWFSHQHDAQEYQAGALTFMTVFDNGNTRQAEFDSNAHGRCQLYGINEGGFTTSVNNNLDVGSYSAALGSSQVLIDGNQHCNSGFIGGTTTSATESNPSTGNIVYQLNTSVPTYRSFRMQSLYTPVSP